MSPPTTARLMKLTIESYYDIARRRPLPVDGGHALEVMFNPETLRTTHEAVQQKRLGLARDSSNAPWSHQKPHELTVTLLFDGTDVGRTSGEGKAPKVAALIRRFLAGCHDVQGTSHEPPYLRLRWGNGIFGNEGFKCRLVSVDTEYTAFQLDGSPLRATLTAKFVEAIPMQEWMARMRLSSPDLTHHRVVRSGDTLPALCREIYGTPAHYLRVAEVNGLDDLRALTPGTELVFPPYAHKEQP